MPGAGRTSLVVVLWVLALAAPAAASFPSSLTTTVEPGSTVRVGSPTLPSGATKATVDVVPTGGEKSVFDRLQIMFAGTKSKKARLLTCVYLYAVATSVTVDDASPVSFEGTDPSLAFLFLAACAQMAAQIPVSASASEASPCKQAQRSVAIEVTRAGSVYRAQIDASSRRTARRLPLRIGCRPRGGGVRLKVRPRSTRKTLRQVVGASLSLGILSPADASGSVELRVTYGRPR